VTDGRGVDCIVEMGGPRTIVMSPSALAVDFEANEPNDRRLPTAKTRRLGGMATPAVLPAETTTTVGQRRSDSPLLLQAHRLTLASPAAGPELKHAGEGVPQSMQHPSSSRRQRVRSNQSRPINCAPHPWHQVLPLALSWTLPV
jgi:hypothetical protein